MPLSLVVWLEPLKVRVRATYATLKTTTATRIHYHMAVLALYLVVVFAAWGNPQIAGWGFFFFWAWLCYYQTRELAESRAKNAEIGRLLDRVRAIQEAAFVSAGERYAIERLKADALRSVAWVPAGMGGPT